MRKLLILFVLSILLLTACSYPSLGFYPFGKIWESDGNSATILYAEIANVFESESRQRYAAEDGQALLLIHCDVHLSMGWQIGENSKVSNFGNRYVLQESIVQNNAQGAQEHILLFILDVGDCTSENLESLTLELSIENADRSARRTQNFVMRN